MVVDAAWRGGKAACSDRRTRIRRFGRAREGREPVGRTMRGDEVVVTAVEVV